MHQVLLSTQSSLYCCQQYYGKHLLLPTIILISERNNYRTVSNFTCVVELCKFSMQSFSRRGPSINQQLHSLDIPTHRTILN